MMNFLFKMMSFQGLAKVLGAKIKKKQLKTMFAVIDADGSGEIYFDEFSKWWAEMQVSALLIYQAPACSI